MREVFSQETYPQLLEQRSIRLMKNIQILELESSLSCELEVHTLETCPLYQALSYTWGSPIVVEESALAQSPSKSYRINMKLFKTSLIISITENLFDALIELSSAGSNPCCIPYLWVDAICINQDDLAEKSVQISLMGSIYSRASRVIVWLGKDTTGVEDFKAIFTEMGNYPTDGLDDYDPELMNKRYEWVMRNLATDMYDPSELKWATYEKFYKTHRWFHRAWIVQEVSLARNIYVCCGSTPLSWGAMGLFAWGLAHGHREATPLMHKISIHGNLPGDAMFKLFHLKDLLIRAGIDPDQPGGLSRWLNAKYGVVSEEEKALAFFQHIIEMIRPFDATDPRDKIFSALGIVTQAFSTDLSGLIQTNYQSSVEDVYYAVTKILCLRLPSITVLYMSGTGAKHLKLPSWVPDYSSEQPNTPLLSNCERKEYNASAGLATKFFPRKITGNILNLHGAKLDAIATTVTRSQNPENDTSHRQDDVSVYLEYANELLKICCESRTTKNGGLNRFATLAKVIIGGRDDVADPGTYLACWLLQTFSKSCLQFDKSRRLSESTFAKHIRQLIDTGEFKFPPLISSFQYFVDMVTRLGTKGPTVEDQQAIEQIDEHITLFHRWTMSMAKGRRLCLTREKYLGLGPDLMQPNDEIWIIVDVKTPLVLRPQLGSNTHIFLGEIYLPECMHGEIVDEKFRNDITSVSLV